MFLPIGAALLAMFAVVAVFGPAIAPYDPTAQDLLAMLDPPSVQHWLGTDELGRDMLSRVIVGTRDTLTIAVSSVCFAAIAGIYFGLIAGYFGGGVDRGISLCIDLVMTIPSLVLAIAVVAAIGCQCHRADCRDHRQLHPADDPAGACARAGIARGRLC